MPLHEACWPRATAASRPFTLGCGINKVNAASVGAHGLAALTISQATRRMAGQRSMSDLVSWPTTFPSGRAVSCSIMATVWLPVLLRAATSKFVLPSCCLAARCRLQACAAVLLPALCSCLAACLALLSCCALLVLHPHFAPAAGLAPLFCCPPHHLAACLAAPVLLPALWRPQGAVSRKVATCLFTWSHAPTLCNAAAFLNKHIISLLPTVHNEFWCASRPAADRTDSLLLGLASGSSCASRASTT